MNKMEEEHALTDSRKRNRESFELSNLLTTKSLRRDSQSASNPLTHTEKSVAYLQSKLGTHPNKIAIKLGRNPNSVKGFLNNAASKKTIMPLHSQKGRWKKGETKLTERHKKLLINWLQAGIMHSTRQCWIKLNKVKSISRVSYHPVRRYLKSIGSFVRPKLKTMVSPANRIKSGLIVKRGKSLILEKSFLLTNQAFSLIRIIFELFE